MTITEGLGATVRTMEDGREQILALHFPGDTIGRPDRAFSAFEVIALTKVEICTVEAQSFARALEHDPVLREHYLQQALDDLDRTRAWMTNLGRKRTLERMASLILMLATRSDDLDPLNSKARGFDLPMSREQMADFMGIAMETVSRAFSDLKKLGVIEWNRRHVTIIDEEMLRAISGDGAEEPVPALQEHLSHEP